MCLSLPWWTVDPVVKCDVGGIVMTYNRPGHEFIIKDTHRGLWYEDGALTKVLGAGRYEIPPQQKWFRELPKVECILVDMRERDLTIKGQEILTADKVAIRVSILVQFSVTDAKAAIHTVENYEDRSVQRHPTRGPTLAGCHDAGRDPHEP